MKIAVFYHCLFFLDDPPELRPMALAIVMEQMEQLQRSGLLDAADEMIVGVNGGAESEPTAAVVLPSKAQVVYHGLQSRAENLTIVELHRWALQHPDWLIFYAHCKGASHSEDSSYGNGVSAPWRRGMMIDLVDNWRTCVAQLEGGPYDIACSHWLWNQADGTQHIPCGNFLWVKSNFVAGLPSIYLRDRIKVSGIAALESRYEAEVFWCNGRRPNVFQMRPNGGGGVP